MAIIQMYCDESVKKGDHSVVTLSGLCIPTFALEEFDNAWNRLLRQYEIPYLHMAKASRLVERCGPRMPRHQEACERTDALRPFADCINKHLEWGLMIALDTAGFNFLSDTKKKGLGSLDNPYYLAFMRATLDIAKRIQDDDHLSIVCDDDEETALRCHDHYRWVRKVNPVFRRKTVAISFANDEHFPALQAADMVAFLSRLEGRRRFFREYYHFVALFNHLIKKQGLEKTVWLSAFAPYKKLKELAEELS